MLIMIFFLSLGSVNVRQKNFTQSNPARFAALCCLYQPTSKCFTIFCVILSCFHH